MDIIRDSYNTVIERKKENAEGSYTSYLFKQGVDKILKKIGEESAETIIAAKNNDKEELICEMSDLIYHLTVLMAYNGVTPDDLLAEHEKRSAKQGNLKVMKQVDKNT